MGSPKQFGNLHIIVIGDFYQLVPVQDTPWYTLPKKGNNTLATHLFQDYFKICTLTEIMHQKGQKYFNEVLNCLCVDKLTSNNIEMLESRKVSFNSNQFKQHVRHFFPLRKQCQEHNDNIYNMAKTEKQVIESYDVVLNISKPTGKILTTAQHSKSYNDQKSLFHILYVAVDFIFIITVNLKKDDGLINGTLCILKYVQYLRPEFPNKASISWVSFDSKNIGKQWCHCNKSIYTSVIKKELTPIWATTCNFSYLHITRSQKQFPLCPATVTTIHSSQGSTFKEMHIDMDLCASPG